MRVASNLLLAVFALVWGILLPLWGLALWVTIYFGLNGDGTRWIILNRNAWACTQTRTIERGEGNGDPTTVGSYSKTEKWVVCNSYTEVSK